MEASHIFISFPFENLLFCFFWTCASELALPDFFHSKVIEETLIQLSTGILNTAPKLLYFKFKLKWIVSKQFNYKRRNRKQGSMILNFYTDLILPIPVSLCNKFLVFWDLVLLCIFGTGILNLGTIDIWDWIILCLRGCPVHYMFNSITGLQSQKYLWFTGYNKYWRLVSDSYRILPQS